MPELVLKPAGVVMPSETDSGSVDWTFVLVNLKLALIGQFPV